MPVLMCMTLSIWSVSVLQLMQAIHASMQESEGQPAGQQNAMPAAEPRAGSRRASALNAEAPELAWQETESRSPREPRACFVSSIGQSSEL